MEKNDEIRLRHMLDSAREAVSFASGKMREDLDRERMLSLALVKAIEIIGEAASKVSENTRAEISEIPWSDIIGMRNRTIHAYYDVDREILWYTVTTELPPLIAKLEKILA